MKMCGSADQSRNCSAGWQQSRHHEPLGLIPSHIKSQKEGGKESGER